MNRKIQNGIRNCCIRYLGKAYNIGLAIQLNFDVSSKEQIKNGVKESILSAKEGIKELEEILKALD